MADVLAELESKHVSHAPLSNAQTIAVCTYLHDLTNGALQQIRDLRGNVRENVAEITKLHGKQAQADASSTSLRQDLESARLQLKTTQDQVDINTDKCRRVQEACNIAQEGVEQLRTGLKVTNTSAQTMRTDVKFLQEELSKLRKNLDVHYRNDINSLAERVQMAVIRLDKVCEDIESAQRGFLGCRDRLQVLETESANAKDDISKLCKCIDGHAEDIASACIKIDSAKENLEMTNAVVLKVHQQVDAAREEVSNIRGEHRALHSRHSALHQEHGQTAIYTRDTGRAVEQLRAAHGSAVELQQRALAQIASLEGQADKADRHFKELVEKVERVYIMATSTQQNLQVTNAFVLPNLNTSDNLSPSFSVSRGSESAGLSTINGNYSTKSPRNASVQRKRREALWVSRNIGTVPDRMAWT